MITYMRHPQGRAVVRAIIKVALARAAQGLFNWRTLAEMALMVAAYVLYFLVRGHTAGQWAHAFVNAFRVIHIESKLGFFVEWHFQQLLLPYEWLIHALTLYYFWGYLPLLVIMAFWLWFRYRQHYYLLRNAFLISGAIGLVIFAIFPVLPPRLLPGGVFTDTLSGAIAVDYDSVPFFNPYAAVPSMHLGWHLLMGIGIAITGRTRLRLLLGTLMPATMFSAIVVTGNHYFLDGIIGMAVALLGFIAAVMLDRIGQRYDLWAVTRFILFTARPLREAIPVSADTDRRRL